MVSEAEKIGFAPGVAGHNLSKTHTSSYYDIWTCDCGLNFHTRLTQAGKASGWVLRNWRDHLGSINAEDVVYAIGSVQKTRVRWDVYVFPRNYSGASDFTTNGHYNSWLNDTGDNWARMYGWAVGIERVHKHTSSKIIKTIARTKSQAFEQARRVLDNNTQFDVKYGTDAEIDAPVLSPNLAATEYVNQVDEALGSKKLAVVRTTLEQLDDFMSFVPILSVKQDQLREHYNEIISLGFGELNGQQFEQEGSDPAPSEATATD